MDLLTFINRLLETGDFEAIMLDEFAQFGAGTRQYLGATVLPERPVTRNMYREGEIKYRTVIANSGGRYSPAQKKAGGEIGGAFLVELGHSDIAREFTGNRYDTLVEQLGQDVEMASQQFLSFLDQMVNLALIEHNERQRWQALLNAQCIRLGDNGYREEVNYPNPAGHRVSASGDWTDPTVDPWAEILDMKALLEEKGYEINRMVTSTQVKNVLLSNPFTARRAGRVVQWPDPANPGSMLEVTQAVDDEDLNRIMERNGLPMLETYDLTYQTQNSTERFFDSQSLFFGSTTGRDEEIVRNAIDPSELRLVTDVLGYHAVGRAVGQRTPGRVVDLETHTNKPPRIEAEGWQTSLPVITDPEAVAVINNITLP